MAATVPSRQIPFAAAIARRCDSRTAPVSPTPLHQGPPGRTGSALEKTQLRTSPYSIPCRTGTFPLLRSIGKGRQVSPHSDSGDMPACHHAELPAPSCGCPSQLLCPSQRSIRPPVPRRLRRERNPMPSAMHPRDPIKLTEIIKSNESGMLPCLHSRLTLKWSTHFASTPSSGMA